MTTQHRFQLDIEALTTDALDGAAELLAARHRRHREAEPLLDPAYENPVNARAAIEAELAAELAGGWVARRGDEIVGYLIGQQKGAVWGANVWVEAAGHAATEPAVLRELYAVAAAAWVGEGRTNHHILVPATDEGLVDAWFTLDFGQQHVHAIREVPGPSFAVVPRSELVIRDKVRDDLDALAELELILPAHTRQSPVFSNPPSQTFEEARADLDEDFDNPAYTYFVAEHDGKLVGAAIGCAIEVSSFHLGPNRVAGAAFLGFAAVFPEARGLGAGKAVGEATLAWSRDAGYESIQTDWRSTNLEADRTWRSLGFRPTFRRMHRMIG
ncbi:MAG: GNAT family N-acetyltransferase [Chloroflexota bacterium]